MRRHRTIGWMLSALVLGCGGTLGPLVTDVRYGPKGELVVTRCMLDISSGGNITTYTLHGCTKSVSPPPAVGSAPSVSAVPPPAGSGATTLP